MYELRDKKKERDFRGLWKKMGVCILALILFFICSVLLYVTKLASGVQQLPDADIREMTNAHLTKETEEKMDDFRTIAIFGVDSRDGNIGKGTSADTQMVLTVNKADGAVRLASIYRDTLLMSNVKTGKCSKTNSSYSEGGPEQAVMALNENLDLEITDYITFSWKAAADAVNILGGIDVDITEAEFAYINAFITETVEQTGVGSHHLEGPGTSHLDGVQAVAYCRLRLMDSDVHRTQRQQLVIQKVMDKIREADPATVNRLLEAVLPQVATSITVADFAELAMDAGTYHLVGTAGFPSVYEEARLGRLGSCLIPNTLESNVTELHVSLYGDREYRYSDRVAEISKEILKQAVGK